MPGVRVCGLQYNWISDQLNSLYMFHRGAKEQQGSSWYTTKDYHKIPSQGLANVSDVLMLQIALLDDKVP